MATQSLSAHAAEGNSQETFTFRHIFKRLLPHDPNILPIRVNFLQTRDFEQARQTASTAAADAWNQGCLFTRKLEELAEKVAKGFAPKPDECRAASYFDMLVRHHSDTMSQHARIIMSVTTAFVEQCNALESLATVLKQPDLGTELDAVKMMRFVNADGTGSIVRVTNSRKV